MRKTGFDKKVRELSKRKLTEADPEMVELAKFYDGERRQKKTKKKRHDFIVERLIEINTKNE